MTREEMLERKAEMELMILHAVCDFEKETGLSVDCIRLVSVRSMGVESQIASVESVVRL